MSNSNLPPGVSSNDIPGNRPEDEADEQFIHQLDAGFSSTHPDEFKLVMEFYEKSHPLAELPEAVYQYVLAARDLGYSIGFQEGVTEEKMAQSLREVENDAID